MDGHVGKPLTVGKLVKQIDALDSKGRIGNKTGQIRCSSMKDLNIEKVRGEVSEI